MNQLKDLDAEIINYDDASMNEAFITAREYEDATKTVVRTLGRDAGTQVAFTGKKAAANIGKGKNNKVVVLPANDPNQKMTKRQYFIGQGFANHETLHRVCTDLDGLKHQMDSMKAHKQHLTFSLTNAIEDVRIENAGKALYPGIPRKLDATAEFAASKFLESDKSKDASIMEDFKKVGPLAITWAGRKKMGYNAPSVQKCLDLLPQEIREMAEKYADEALALRTGARGVGDVDREEAFKGSHDAVEMARRITGEILQPPKDKKKEQEQEGQGKDGKGKGQGNGGDPSTGQGNSGRGDSGEEGDDTGGHGGAISTKFIPQTEEPENPDFLAPLVDELEFDTKGKYVPMMTNLDTWVKQGDNTHASMCTFGQKNNLRQYQKTMDTLTGKMAVMKRKLEKTLQAKMEREFTTGHRTGSLDVAKKGTSIMRRRENVYRKREDGKDVNAAVTLLIDASGSMDGDKILLAQQSAIALAEAIARVGVPLEILVFNTRMPNDDEIVGFHQMRDLWQTTWDEARGRGDSDQWARIDPISMYEVKTFDQSMNLARNGLGAINKMVSAANADGESLLLAWNRLKRRPEKKKILMVLSDGEPACHGNRNVLCRHLKETVLQIGKEGGDCVGIGIQSNAVKTYYPRSTVVNNLEELAGKTLDNLARLLLGERFVIDNGNIGKKAA